LIPWLRRVGLLAALVVVGCEGDDPVDDDSAVPTDDDDDDSVDDACSLGSLEPGPVPPELPRIELLVDDPSQATPGVLVTSLLSGQHRPILIDTAGEYLWWGDAEDHGITVSRAALSRDRCAVLYLAETDGLVVEEDYVSRLHRTYLDGSGTETIEIDDAHHDFAELPDGTIAALARDYRLRGEVWVAGDKIVEIDPDGTTRDIWSVFDDADLVPQGPAGNEAIDWSHANAMDYDEAADLYLVSLRHFDAIVAVDRATGARVWTLGGDDTSFELLGDPELDAFREQHQFELLGGGLLVFDNGETDDVSSRIVEYAWAGDDAYEAVWRHVPSPPFNCYALGDVTRLSGGNTGITWSTAGLIEEVTPDGDVVMRLGLEMGAGFGYTTWVEASR
jgi:hypothetical protein